MNSFTRVIKSWIKKTSVGFSWSHYVDLVPAIKAIADPDPTSMIYVDPIQVETKILNSVADPRCFIPDPTIFSSRIQIFFSSRNPDHTWKVECKLTFILFLMLSGAKSKSFRSGIRKNSSWVRIPRVKNHRIPDPDSAVDLNPKESVSFGWIQIRTKFWIRIQTLV
jgi:hypothetical protein